jgi:hypothetical protein
MAQQLTSDNSNILNTTESQNGFSRACALRYENRSNSTSGASHPSSVATYMGSTILLSLSINDSVASLVG